MASSDLREQVEAALREFDPAPRANDSTWAEMVDAALAIVRARIVELPVATSDFDGAEAYLADDVLAVFDD